MGVEGNDLFLIVFGGGSEFSQGDLEMLSLGDGVRFEELVDGGIGSDKGQAAEQFKAFLGEATLLSDAGCAEGSFMDQLHGESGFEARGGLLAPSEQQIPGAEAEVLGEQKPESDRISGDLVGQ